MCEWGKEYKELISTQIDEVLVWYFAYWNTDI
jgi:hypothetical protein